MREMLGYRNLIITITTVAALSGCALTNTDWVKEGASEQDKEIALAQCNEKVYSVAGRDQFSISSYFVIENCMKGQGWRKPD